MMFDSWTKFSDEVVQQRMLEAAQRLGVRYSVDRQGRFHYCHSETSAEGKANPNILALDEAFGPEWIALQMGSSEELERCVSELAQAGIRHLVERTNGPCYVIVDRFRCPPKWGGHQV